MLQLCIKNSFPRALSVALYMLVACLSLAVSDVIAAPVDDASKYIESVGNKAVDAISSKSLSKDAKSKKIEQLFRDNVDINWVGRFAIGRFWRQITDDQKKRYFKVYEDFLVKHYATRFTDYTGGSFKITGLRDDGDGEFTINMQIKSDAPDGDSVAVDYRVRLGNNGKFSIFDIIVEGVSMINTQRSEFTSVITNKGFDYLITQLASKSDSLVTQTTK